VPHDSAEEHVRQLIRDAENANPAPAFFYAIPGAIWWLAYLAVRISDGDGWIAMVPVIALSIATAAVAVYALAFTHVSFEKRFLLFAFNVSGPFWMLVLGA